MTNPTQALRMVIVYLISITLAITVGFLLTDPMDYGTLFIFGAIVAIMVSPFIIKWYHPLLVFGLASPIYCFFLVGNPPLSQVVVLLCLSLAIINRTINSEKRFLSVPAVTWPLLFTIAVVIGTAELTGGIGLHTLGGEVSGGKKYITLLTGILSYFALVSSAIPQKKVNFYLMLYFLPPALSFIGDLFPYLPSPLNYINLLIPPSSNALEEGNGGPLLRLGAVATSAGAAFTFMLAKYGLRGIFRTDKPFRFIIFSILGISTLFGGFRIVFISYAFIVFVLFFLEGIHRTRLVVIFALLLISIGTVVFTISDKLPLSFQRALTVVPFLKLDPIAVADAEQSKVWREQIWQDTWPKVPHYLLLGKGYALTPEDFMYMGNGTFSNDSLDKSEVGLAVSMDYHNGPLSTLMPFGIWGMISFLWIASVSLWVTYRNYHYGEPYLQSINNILLVFTLLHIFGYFFLFGAYVNDIGEFMQVVGFSVALNWGVRKPKPQNAQVFRTKPVRPVRSFPGKRIAPQIGNQQHI